MATTTPQGLLVWRRNLEPSSRRWAMWTAIGIAGLAAFGAFAAYMADDTQSIGSFVALGVIGAGLFLLIPRVYDWGRRRNPEIRMEGRELVWAKVRVPIDQVHRWGAAISTQSVYNGRTTTRSRFGVLRFEMNDGSEKKFIFSHLGDDELVELSAAIEPILPGRRV